MGGNKKKILAGNLSYKVRIKMEQNSDIRRGEQRQSVAGKQLSIVDRDAASNCLRCCLLYSYLVTIFT